ncbi:MAG TPA: SDR family NAD(P)-dependent oxidoreductase [Vicinamibacterales bacterium]|nr:SDR family NAD(P)-dependent oxidoreductase [Vicinamibacterales bacterium]
MTRTEPGGGLLQGRHAVVTGGGRGLGAAIAGALAAQGAHLTLMGRTAAALEERAGIIGRTYGGRARAVVVDVSEPAQVSRAFAEAIAETGAIEILVNNAGQADAGPFEDITLEGWDRLLRVNLTGPFLCIRQVLPAMLAARRGRIVTVASTAALKGYPRTAAYCASKHGVVGLTRALALETARSGVTVNAVCPGYTDDTDMLKSAIDNVRQTTGRSPDEARAMLARLSPRGTFVTPAEVADAVVWLCSPTASAITGQAIPVAAGEVMP